MEELLTGMSGLSGLGNSAIVTALKNFILALLHIILAVRQALGMSKYAL